MTVDSTVLPARKTVTLYLAGSIYQNDTLQFFGTAEGRARPLSSTRFVYDYFLKDHLGNTRVVLTDDYNVASPILEATSYYPFGLEQKGISKQATVRPNKYKFNGGSELNTDFSLDWYETNFRSLDPQLGRFWQVDPLADGTPDISAYAFVHNNPIRFLDPMGLDTLTPILLRSEPWWRKLPGGSNDTYTGSDLINKRRGLERLPGFDGSYNHLKQVTVVSRPKPKRIRLSTKISQWTNRIALFTILVGLGPENPAADVLAGGEEVAGQSAAIIVRAGETVLDIFRGWQFAKDKIDHLKGGKQWKRDKNFGINDKGFWDWWHNGGGKNGQDATPEDYETWKDLGRPRGPKGNKPWKQ